MKNDILVKIGEKFNIDVSNVALNITSDNIAHISGTVNTWEEVVKLGRKVLKATKADNLVNDVFPKDSKKPFKRNEELIKKAQKIGLAAKHDILIIGAGISGCSVARDLSKLDLSIGVLEKELDVSEGATKANNGMIHPGNAVVPGTLKAKMNLRGNFLYTKLAEELKFEFERTGSLILYTAKENRLGFVLAYLGAVFNKVPGYKLLSYKKAKEIDPLTPKCKKALWTPTTAYVDGFEVAIALAENAAENGVKFYFDNEVVDIVKDDNKFSVYTNNGIYEANIVINAAGIYADYMAWLVNDRFYTIHPRKGVIAILDKNSKGPSICTSIPNFDKTKHSKGGGGQRTVANNPLFGPSSLEVQDRDDVSVDKDSLDYAMKVGEMAFDNRVTRADVIAYFAGLRAASYTEDFIIEESKKVDGFIHVAAIQSPGLAAAPAISELVLEIVEDHYKRKAINIKYNEKYNPNRKEPLKFDKLSLEEKDKIIKKNPLYGNIICRCESITEGEIVDALHRPIPCLTLDAVKKRVRAGAGRCQGGFCAPTVISIMARELKVDVLDICQKSHSDPVLVKKSRE